MNPLIHYPQLKLSKPVSNIDEDEIDQLMSRTISSTQKLMYYFEENTNIFVVIHAYSFV